MDVVTLQKVRDRSATGNSAGALCRCSGNDEIHGLTSGAQDALEPEAALANLPAP